ncbi:hypothetical protein AMECASPLE_032686 [Ameca splendens]|uniref:Uncharacterized protein n=1 Tax=Ameca splendens TaxID=208324 RepID=A0ABV0XW34_9TELE
MLVAMGGDFGGLPITVRPHSSPGCPRFPRPVCFIELLRALEQAPSCPGAPDSRSSLHFLAQPSLAPSCCLFIMTQQSTTGSSLYVLESSPSSPSTLLAPPSSVFLALSSSSSPSASLVPSS